MKRVVKKLKSKLKHIARAFFRIRGQIVAGRVIGLFVEQAPSSHHPLTSSHEVSRKSSPGS
jgi:hypothetical protein